MDPSEGRSHGKSSPGRSGSRCGSRRPLGDQLLLTHDAVAVQLVRKAAVLLLEGAELLLKGVQNGMVFVHQRHMGVDQSLTESEEGKTAPGVRVSEPPWCAAPGQHPHGLSPFGGRPPGGPPARVGPELQGPRPEAGR